MFCAVRVSSLKSQVEEDEQELWAQGAQDGIVEYR